MADIIEIKIPDIGGASKVEVIELLVKPGDVIAIDSALITLESDKASMEIPSSAAGRIVDIKVKVGDKVSEGDIILTIESTAAILETKPTVVKEEVTAPSPVQEDKSITIQETHEIKVPDIGGAQKVEVIELMVKPGDVIEKDTPLIALESEKASMEIPSCAAGRIVDIQVKVGDKISEGDVILTLESTIAATKSIDAEKKGASSPLSAPIVPVLEPSVKKQSTDELPSVNANIGASPAVRRLARELGVNLAAVTGSGRKSRITKEDIQTYVKKALSENRSGSGMAIPAAEKIDFSKFGTVVTKPLHKIKKLTGIYVHRSWITIPHVTQFDEADITELEAFRKAETASSKDSSYKLTILAFVCEVVAKALIVFPQFNASLDASGENLILKQYVNVGIAVETPNGLVVPVIKGVDQLSVADIAKEMARLSTKAREKGLMPADMSGGCFTISSLGGIGGTAFTPIVNSPEVAILGLSRSSIKPVYEEGEFKPRLMLPLSLSYDHRVIDGAEAARFTRFIADFLSDIRKILL
jgi:pyruvate dehydrogenase E2 component (dihydrolipoamide acetyltransferase)